MLTDVNDIYFHCTLLAVAEFVVLFSLFAVFLLTVILFVFNFTKDLHTNSISTRLCDYVSIHTYLKYIIVR